MKFVKRFHSLQGQLNLYFCSIGCVSCYLLQNYLQLPNFLSSILVGLIGSFLPETKYYDASKAIAAIYCGSFASMCSLSYFTSPYDFLPLCFFLGFYFSFLSPYLRGVGGKLGSIGFLSSLSFVLFKGLF